MLLFSNVPTRTLGSTLPLLQSASGAAYPDVKTTGREDNHSPSPTAKAKRAQLHCPQAFIACTKTTFDPTPRQMHIASSAIYSPINTLHYSTVGLGTSVSLQRNSNTGLISLNSSAAFISLSFIRQSLYKKCRTHSNFNYSLPFQF
jgi:hypothetical protein